MTSRPCVEVGAAPRAALVTPLYSQPPTANRYHLAAPPRWVGSGSHHDIDAAKPFSGHGSQLSGVWFRYSGAGTGSGPAPVPEPDNPYLMPDYRDLRPEDVFRVLVYSGPQVLPKVPQQLLLHDRIMAEMLDCTNNLLDVVSSTTQRDLTR